MTPPQAQIRDVAVVGAGPAGVAAAVGLARLGYSVVLFAGPMRTGIEGASERTLQCLQRLGLLEASGCMTVRGPRVRHWADAESINSTEFLLDRGQFDHALRRDAIAAGVLVCDTRAESFESIGESWSVRGIGEPAMGFRAVVDARGRGARGIAARGPALLALIQQFASEASDPGTAVVMGAERWCWFAQDGRGRLDVQMVCSPIQAGSKAALQQLLMVETDLPQRFSDLLRSAKPVGPLRARAAGAFLRKSAEKPGLILAGDAAMALDPLSGHGIYEALASADVSIAALHTFLQSGDWSPIRQFVHERAQELWIRKATAAHSFYQSAAGVNHAHFWASISTGYATLAATRGMLHDPRTQIQSRPVLDAGRIILRRVLVTPRWPRGVWRYGEIDIAELLDGYESHDGGAQSLAARLQQSAAAVQAALEWLRVQGALPAGGANGFTRAGPLGAPMARSSM